MDEVLTGSWPHFRGTDFDNISKDPTALAESWDTSGPGSYGRLLLVKVIPAGSAEWPCIHSRLQRKKKADMLRCFSLSSGKEIWRRWYKVEMKRNHGYSRTIPSVTDKYVVTIGPRSHVMCLDPISGKCSGNTIWKENSVSPDLQREE